MATLDSPARTRSCVGSCKVALLDVLTGLPNRTLFHDRLGQALRAAERAGGSLTRCLMDLDRFTDINDTLGHEAGDTVLGEVGRLPARSATCVGHCGSPRGRRMRRAPAQRHRGCAHASVQPHGARRAGGRV